MQVKCQNLPANVDNAWDVLSKGILEATDETCGWTKGGVQRHKETWWWNEIVDDAIKAKRKAWKLWKNGGNKEDYLEMKRAAKSAVYFAKRDAQEEKFASINNNADKNKIFKIARRMKQDNLDIVGEKCVRDDNGHLALSLDDKLKAWQSHYDKLLNEEFPWNTESLSVEEPVQGPAIQITNDLVSKAINKMKPGKAAGPSGIIVEMIKAGGDQVVTALTSLFNGIIHEGVVPNGWHLSYIINLYKGKGDALSRGNYRGLKLQEQMMKVLEHILNEIIREQVSIDEMQFGFMPCRAIFILKKNIYILLLLTWKRHLIEFLVKFSGGLCGNWVWWNGL